MKDLHPLFLFSFAFTFRIITSHSQWVKGIFLTQELNVPDLNKMWGYSVWLQEVLKMVSYSPDNTRTWNIKCLLSRESEFWKPSSLKHKLQILPTCQQNELWRTRFSLQTPSLPTGWCCAAFSCTNREIQKCCPPYAIVCYSVYSSPSPCWKLHVCTKEALRL